VPGYFIYKRYFDKKYVDGLEKIIFIIALGFLINLFNMIFLTGVNTLPYILSLLNIKQSVNINQIIKMIIIESIVFSKKTIPNDIKIKLTINYKPKLSDLTILFGLGLSVVPHIYYVLKNNMPATAIVWAYNSLTKTILSDGVIPLTRYSYGEISKIGGTYISYNLISALINMTLNLNDINFLRFMSIINPLFTFFFIYYMYKNLLKPPYDVAAATLTMMMKLFIFKLATHKAESFSIFTLFLAYWITLIGYKNKDKFYSILGGIWIGVNASTNAAIALVGVCILGAVTLVDTLYEKDIKPIKWSMGIGLVALVSVICIFSFSTGKIPVINSLIDTEPVVTTDIDLSWEFVRILNPEAPDTPNFERYMPGYFRKEMINNWKFLGILFVISITSTILLRRSRKNMLTLLLAELALLCVSLFFFFYYDTYVPQKSGFNRVLPYTYMILSLLPVTILQDLPDIRLKLTKKIKLSYKWIVLVILLLSIYNYNAGYLRNNHRPAISQDAYDSMVWIRENTPKDAILLTNEWTNGAISGIGERNVLNDGDAPYLRMDVVEHVGYLFDETRAFYTNPEIDNVLLSEYNVSYVILSMNKAFRSNELVTSTPQKFRNAGFRPVFRSDTVIIYRVRQ